MQSVKAKSLSRSIVLLGLAFFSSQPSFANSEKTISICPVEEVYYLRLIKAQSSQKKNDFGALTVTSYAISKEKGGPQIGLNVARRLDLGIVKSDSAQQRLMETQVTNFLPQGTTVSLQATSYDNGIVSNRSERPIVGGTGKYQGANGVVITETVEGSGTPHYKITLKIDLACNPK